jgi:hypothetical protein
MAASFPASVKSFTTKVDGVTDIVAEHINSPQEEIVAIETELLVNMTGWNSAGETWTYVSATSFRISGDKTTRYQKGDKIKLTQTTVKYFYVVSVVYSSPNTTITVTGGTDYTLANAAISANYFSKAESPQGFPGRFAYAPTPTGFSSGPTLLAEFSIQGVICHVSLFCTGNGTSNATTLTVPAPVAAATLSGMSWRGLLTYTRDNNVVQATPGQASIDSAGTSFALYKDSAGTAWTNSGNKAFGFTMDYRI